MPALRAGLLALLWAVSALPAAAQPVERSAHPVERSAGPVQSAAGPGAAPPAPPALAPAATLPAAPPAASLAPVASVPSRLDRIRQTGVLHAGTRGAEPPFAQRLEDGRFTGFSVDLLDHIRRGLELRLGRSVELRLTEVTAANRIEMVRSGQIDLECGLTTPTWNREITEGADFSLPFFVDGTRILTRAPIARTGMAGLRDRRIAVVRNSTTVRIVGLAVPTATLVEVANMGEAMAAFEAETVDAVANIGVTLENLRARSNRRIEMALLPERDNLQPETMACLLPENDSALRDAVNLTLACMLQGVERYSGAYMDLYYRWFGAEGLLYYPLDEDRAKALAAQLIWQPDRALCQP